MTSSSATPAPAFSKRLSKAARTTLHLAGAALLVGALAGCMGFGGGSAGGLSQGLSQRMDVPGASLDRAQALGLINSYRATTGAAPLTADAALEAQAQTLAAQYAGTGNAPRTPQGVTTMKLSAGYATFAETFSGWRNSPEDARGLTVTGATRAGIAAVFNPSSSYGVYWVLVLGN